MSGCKKKSPKLDFIPSGLKAVETEVRFRLLWYDSPLEVSIFLFIKIQWGHRKHPYSQSSLDSFHLFHGAEQEAKSVLLPHFLISPRFPLFHVGLSWVYSGFGVVVAQWSIMDIICKPPILLCVGISRHCAMLLVVVHFIVYNKKQALPSPSN